MKSFLKSLGLSDEEIASITGKYVEKHKGDATPPTELPVYISKARLDEVLGKQRAAEESLTAEKAAHEETKKTLKGLQDGAGDETKKILDAAKKEWDKTHKAEIEALKKDYSITEAIRDAKGRNVKAIKALIDSSKDVAEQLKNLKESDSYLFETDNNIPSGTGKNNPGQQGSNESELQAMRKAVGI